jgi:hypothetical protein
MRFGRRPSCDVQVQGRTANDQVECAGKWPPLLPSIADICACQTISQFGGVVCHGNVGHDLPIKHLLVGCFTVAFMQLLELPQFLQTNFIFSIIQHPTHHL